MFLMSRPVIANDKPAIKLLTKEEAAAAIVEEKIEPYFKLLGAADMAAKVGEELAGDTLEAKREACRKKYQSFMLDFTDAEQAIVAACIERVHPVLREHYPKIAATPWSVIKKADRLEGAAHFTRESHIVLSEHVLVRAAKLAAEGKQDAAVNALLPLLLHEQTHVLKRLHGKVFAEFYVSHWGLKHAEKIVAGDWLDARQMVNPDAVDVNWILPVKDEAGAVLLHWPRIILTKTEGVPVMFRDMQMVLVELEREGEGFRARLNADGTPVMQPLSQVKAFAEKFPHGNAYHPNEAAAALLPAVILADLNPDAVEKNEARAVEQAKARKWLREAFR